MADKKTEHAPDEYLYDVRLIERHVARGRLTRQQVEAKLAACPDVADQVETVDLGRLSSASRPARS